MTQVMKKHFLGSVNKQLPMMLRYTMPRRYVRRRIISLGESPSFSCYVLQMKD